jgi:PAS domain S-box-containing protein
LDQNPPYDELVQRINELEADNKNLHRSVDMLQENEERYRTLVEYSHDVLYSVSADQIITYVSPQIVNFGWTPEELISRNFLELAVAPESREHVIDSWNQGAVGNDTHPTEFKWIGRGAPVEWVEVVGNNFYDNLGNFLYQIGVLRDITARKRTEEAQKKVHLLNRYDSEIKFIVLSTYEERKVMENCMSSGASGYVLKRLAGRNLINAVEEVQKGGKYVSPFMEYSE